MARVGEKRSVYTRLVGEHQEEIRFEATVPRKAKSSAHQPLKINALHSFETSGNTNRTTRCHIPEDP